MAVAKDNTTLTTDITVKAREVDFVEQFSKNWQDLLDILGIMKPIRKAPGTTLVSYKGSIEQLQESVGEGEEIPYSKAKVKEVTKEDLTIDKYASAVTIEAVNKYGADIAVQKVDEAFRDELQSKVMTEFYDFLKTGNLKSTQKTFQMGVAMAIGSVVDKFKKMHRTATQVVTFVNTLDAYEYLGAANIDVQTSFGIQYVQNFMGATVMILSSELERNQIIATPVNNIDLYYVDPGDSQFKQLGLDYTVQGETNLIGFHANGNYNTAVGEIFAIMGMKLWAEYIDGIAVVTVGE